MKTILTLTRLRIAVITTAAMILFNSTRSEAQICASPATIIYGLSSAGAIYPINVTNATTGVVVKNTTYSGNAVTKANGLAYNSTNGKFYYFKRNVGASPQEFVSYDPATTFVTVLAVSTCTNEVHTGCITADGLYYYSIDIDANLNCYNIVMNTWTKITSAFTDQFGNNVASVIKSQSAGDIAFDGNGRLWIVTSDNSNFAVYSINGPLPTTAVAGLTVSQRVSPLTATPSGNSIAGIAFNPTGQIFMATRGDDRLYKLNNNLTLTFIGNLGVADIGNDLTSCAFPLGVLPITWLNFSAALSNKYNEVELTWAIAEKNNPGFYVQYSTDGLNWRDLSFVPINMFDVEGQQYYYKHSNPAPGNNYYRIKTSNENGKDSYTQVKVVTLKSGATITVWPNPASSSIHINAENNSPMQVRVYDMAGRLQLNKQLPAGEKTISISSLNAGTYMLNIVTQDGLNQNQKFIKQ
jgi:Secretion system C-terminal sorting domain